MSIKDRIINVDTVNNFFKPLRMKNNVKLTLRSNESLAAFTWRQVTEIKRLIGIKMLHINLPLGIP